jgi:hypothetical protein
MRIVLCFASVWLVFAGLATADVVPTLTGVTGSSPFTYEYSISFGPGINLDSTAPFDQFFTIYDFAGFNGVQSAPAGWTFVASPGLTPPRVNVVDNPTVPNLTWKYVSSPVIAGPTIVGSFAAQSTLGPLFTGGTFASQGTNATATESVENVGSVSVPSTLQEGPIPEPATGLLFGFGLVALSLVSRRFVRS